MSIEMASAIDADMAVINEDKTKTYVDNEEVLEVPSERVEKKEEPKKETKKTEKTEQTDAAAALFG